MEHDTGEPGLRFALGAEQPDAADDPEVADELEIADEPEAADEAPESAGRSAEQWQATGEPRVDEALRRLDGLAELPVAEHPAVFEQVHARLRDVLGELDSGSLAGAQGRQDS
jgi:hypothetical protein